MNDDFLTRFRKPPTREFSEALYERMMTKMNAPKRFTVRRMTFAAALCLAVIAALVFLPSAHAALSHLVRQIGGVTYIGPEDVTAQPTLSESEITLVPEETLSLEEARIKVPFEFHLPEWTPDGYIMSSTVRISYFPSKDGTNPFVSITWIRSREVGGPGVIRLSVSRPVQWLVDLDHLQEVQINGQPAGLTGGGWNADTGTWSTTENDLTLTWTQGEVMYQFLSNGASVKELIQMAESIP
jgi:hypothetical protein